jgi:hypothetical protein
MNKHKNDEYDSIKILSSLYPCTVWRLIMMQPGSSVDQAVGELWIHLEAGTSGFGFFKEFTFCSRKSLMRDTAFQPEILLHPV